MRLTEVKAYVNPRTSTTEVRESVLALNPMWFVGASVIFAHGSWSDGLTDIDTVKGRYVVREKPEEVFDLVKALIKEIADS